MNSRTISSMNFFAFLLVVNALYSCKLPNENHSLTSDSQGLVGSAAAGATVGTCRWADAKSYGELKTLALFRYDLPDSRYEAKSYSAPILTSGQVLEDLACLRLVLTHVYSGTELFKQQGEDLVANLDALVAHYQSNGAPSKSPLALGMSIPKLWGQAFDGHTEAGFYSYKDFYARIRQGFNFSLQYPIFVHTKQVRDVVSCDGLHLSQSFDSTLRGVAFTGYLSPATVNIPSKVECKAVNGQTVTLDLMSRQEADSVQHSEDEKQAGATLVTTQDGIDIVTIASFPDPATDEQKKIAAQLATSDRPLIIDVRGDAGGAPQFNQLLQDALLSTDQTDETSESTSIWSWLKVLSVTQVFEDTIEQYTYDPKEVGSRGIQNRAHLAEEIKDWEDQEASHMASLGIKTMRDFKTEKSVEKTGGKRVAARTQPIVILTDRGCGSQCDFFVSDMRHLPSVKGHILGLPTAGRLNFGSEGLLFLPNSRIRVSPSGARNEHKPRVIEGEGIQPDFFVLDEDIGEQGVAFMRQLLGRGFP